MNRVQLNNLETTFNDKNVTYNDYTWSCPPGASGFGIGIDDREALEQAIKKILLTERGAYDIYPSNYGINLDKYIGRSYSYIRSDLQREIKLALLSDDRIIDIVNFKIFKLSTDEMVCAFTVKTIYGDVTISGSLTLN